ncbi:MAG: Tim44 domain-containing protein [Alphaproteobacteria bacterium]|nr:MAG: Tim44 domain-containing protein [Alphaproteobacteria bacterium]
MSETASFFEFVILGTVAVIVLVALRSVLGRKTGNEEERAQTVHRRREAAPTPGTLAPAPVADAPSAAEPASIEDFAEPGSELAQGLSDIQMADRRFDPGTFLSGAKGAYEMIVGAFATDDKKALKPLLTPEVFASFTGVIDDRKSRGETVETTFIGINEAKLTEASLTGRIAEVTVRFVSELISLTKNSEGAVIEGDPTQVYKVADIWTFSRDVKSNDPNWKLSATASG